MQVERMYQNVTFMLSEDDIIVVPNNRDDIQ